MVNDSMKNKKVFVFLYDYIYSHILLPKKNLNKTWQKF